MKAIQLTTTYVPARPIWCAGCGHFGVQHALQAAMDRLQITRHETLILAGIGCSGTIQNNLGTYGYHALHGRVLPAAAGSVLANPELTVVASGGDGDGYAIGAGHLVHAFRRDVPFVYIVMNNETYGLTKGQHSPTRDHSYQSHREGPLDAIQLGLSIATTGFIARGYSGAFDQLVRLTTAALEHARARRGFAFLEVISPCVTYLDAYTRWESGLVDLDATAGYNPTDRAAAFAASVEAAAGGRMVTGLVYREDRPDHNTDVNPARAEVDPAAHSAELTKIRDQYRVAIPRPG